VKNETCSRMEREVKSGPSVKTIRSLRSQEEELNCSGREKASSYRRWGGEPSVYIHPPFLRWWGPDHAGHGGDGAIGNIVRQARVTTHLRITAVG
jgi:hypothetical protein